MGQRITSRLANRARTGVPRLIAELTTRPRGADRAQAGDAKQLIGFFAEWGFFDAMRALPASTAIVVDGPFFPVVASELMFRTSASLHRLSKVEANPRALRGKSDILVLSAAPHRHVVRSLSAAVPTARVRSVFNAWLPEVIARRGFFGAGGEPPDVDSHTNGPDVRYIILATPRSGSYYLCELLFQAGLGIPREHLRPSTLRLFRDVDGFRPTEFADCLVRLTSRNGFFGTKVILHYLTEVVVKKPSRLHLLRRWIDRFNVKILYLERRDAVLQATSAVVAIKQNSWRLIDPADVNSLRPPPYNFDEILVQYRHIMNQRKRAEENLASFPSVYRLAYEDLDEHPLETLNGVLDFLGAPARDELPAVKTLKVRNDTTLAFAERFRDELAARGED